MFIYTGLIPFVIPDFSWEFVGFHVRCGRDFAGRDRLRLRTASEIKIGYTPLLSFFRIWHLVPPGLGLLSLEENESRRIGAL